MKYRIPLLAFLSCLPWTAVMGLMFVLMFDSRFTRYLPMILASGFALNYAIAFLFWRRLPEGEKTFSPLVMSIATPLIVILTTSIFGYAFNSLAEVAAKGGRWIVIPATILTAGICVALVAQIAKIRFKKNSLLTKRIAIAVFLLASVPFLAMIEKPCFSKRPCMIARDATLDSEIPKGVKKDSIKGYIRKQALLQEDVGNIEHIFIVDAYRQGFLDTVLTLEMTVYGDKGYGRMVYRDDWFCQPLSKSCTWDVAGKKTTYIYVDPEIGTDLLVEKKTD